MYKNFNDYYKAYLDQYSKTPINEKDNKKKYTFKLDQYFLLGIPFIFIFILSSIIDIDRINYNELAKTDAEVTEAAAQALKQSPLPIFVG